MQAKVVNFSMVHENVAKRNEMYKLIKYIVL